MRKNFLSAWQFNPVIDILPDPERIILEHRTAYDHGKRSESLHIFYGFRYGNLASRFRTRSVLLQYDIFPVYLIKKRSPHEFYNQRQHNDNRYQQEHLVYIVFESINVFIGYFVSCRTHLNSPPTS